MRVRLIRPASPSATALYRIRDAAGDLLYVGIGYEPSWRIERHLRKDWGPQIATIEVEWYDLREEAAEAEKAAIRSEAPRCNVQRYRRVS